ncbi:MAG TPA: hypothetical protein VFS19_05920 [Planctomycetota bacterium]|nr:hypothetical protein [Planctomycetota bacterium]
MRVELSSGLWDGYYEQYGGRHGQTMTLEFADGLMRGDGIDSIGAFTIEGEYRVDAGDVRVGWIKTYEGRHSVLYLGHLDNGRIVGRWEIQGWGDKFALKPVQKRIL